MRNLVAVFIVISALVLKATLWFCVGYGAFWGTRELIREAKKEYQEGGTK